MARTARKIIDAHQHVFWHGRDAAGLIADMNQQAIRQAWLLTWEIPVAEDARSYHEVLNPVHLRPDGTHAGIPLADLLKARDRYPNRFIVGYCPDPRRGDAPGLLESAHRIHGVRVCGEWKFRVLFDDPRCLNLFRRAGELKMPVVLHLDVPYLRGEQGEPIYQPEWYGGTVANLERALAGCPRTIFIGHAPGFWREISGDADRDEKMHPFGKVTPGGRLYRLFETYPNLYADLSAGSGLRALQRDRAHARKFLAQFADRLLFGRDFYGGELPEFLQSLRLPRPVADKLFFRNADRVLAGSRITS